MSTCLIGSSGFIGSNLLTQRSFKDLYRSTNIDDIRGKHYELLVCAGVSAVKWVANKHPEQDRAAIDRLWQTLRTVRADHAILISTVDVYPVTSNVDELFDCAHLANNAYGAHRLELENMCSAHFKNISVVRLPGVFGPGLKKNVIFDLMHGNILETINLASVFQYYDVRGLWADLEVILNCTIPLINLVTEPIPTSAIVERFFPRSEVGSKSGAAVFYDLRTRYAQTFGKTDYYRWTRAEVLSQLSDFLISESTDKAGESVR